MRLVHTICEACLYAKVEFVSGIDLIIEYNCMLHDKTESSFNYDTEEWERIISSCYDFVNEDDFACPIPF
jgi:hypothetical protein